MVPSAPPPSFLAEREALARLLASRAFARSPNLEKLLVYLCTRHFEGVTGIKEYHLATEALGRPADFDPKSDSIVRVEMHRLRRRLREHYEATPGEPIRIIIPEKSYTPEFRATAHENVSTALQPLEVSGPVEVVRPPASVPPSGSRRSWLVPAALALAASAAWLLLTRGTSVPAPAVSQSSKAAPPMSDAPVVAAIQSDEVRILAGRPPGRYLDRDRHAWEGDQYFTGGAAAAVQRDVNTQGLDSNLFGAVREGEFQYDIPVKPGVYELQLIFAETEYGESNPLGGGEASRVFHIEANGRTILRDFDVISDAQSPNMATIRAFRDIAPAQDGKIHLRWIATGSGKPFVNAILLRPGLPGRTRPIRIACRTQAFRDARGVLWEPDRYYRGGVQITRPHGAPGAEGEIFRGERYGNFSYAVPVPDGNYAVRLYFWEYWWGTGHPGNGGVGSRIFSVYSNRKPLLVDFDIIGSGAAGQATVQQFHGLAPNAQGKLVLEFVPKLNYGMVNAFEVLDEPR